MYVHSVHVAVNKFQYSGPCDLRLLHFGTSLYLKTYNQLTTRIYGYPSILRQPSV